MRLLRHRSPVPALAVLVAIGVLAGVYLTSDSSGRSSAAALAPVTGEPAAATSDDVQAVAPSVDPGSLSQTSPEPTTRTSTTTRPPATHRTSAAPAPSSSTAPPTAPTTAAPDDGFAWLPFGPASPDSPPPFAWYGTLEMGQCINGPPALGLWIAVEMVCEAAINGDTTKWAVAESTDTSGPDDSGNFPCLASAMRALLARALAWHDRNPNKQPKIQLAVRGAPTACAFSIDQVQLAGLPDACGSAPMPGALIGPITGGTAIVLTGDIIDQDLVVRIAGNVAPIICAQAQVVAVQTPPVDRQQFAQIVVSNVAGDVIAPVRFEYDDT